MVYCGCGTCCAKITWFLSVLLLLAAVVGLAVGLYWTVPCAQKLVACNPNLAGKVCWDQFWTCTKSGNAPGLFFFLACAGAAALLLSLCTFCCFCCQRNPRHPKKPRKGKKGQQDQFIAGDSAGGAPHTSAATTSAAAPGDTAVYSDQYAAYDPYAKPGNVAHV